MPVWIALGTLGAYLVGSVPFALIISRVFYRIDIREHGSGNVGATNVVRVLGKGPGIACFFLDFLKGFVPTWLGAYFGLPWWAVLLLGVAAILGHSRSVFLRFTGGKSVATGAGVVLALSPWVGLSALAIWAVVFGLSRIVSLGSILAAAALPLLMILFREPVPYVVFSVVVSLYVIVRHRSNIERLLKGQEQRMGTKKP